MAPPQPVSILLLGSGWTSKFLVPHLQSNNISFARTRRSVSKEESDEDNLHSCKIGEIFPFTVHDSINVQSCQHLPAAQMVVTVFPLKIDLVQQLINAYEQATSCSPAWVALGSTGAWQKPGISDSNSSINPDNERAKAEEILLQMHEGNRRRTSVLNLAGLYGDERNPVNFAKRACDTKEKLEKKTSLHLVHGIDVARAILGMYHSLQNQEHSIQMWGKRWIVTGEQMRKYIIITMVRRNQLISFFSSPPFFCLSTDGHVYDWWQLLQTLKPIPIPNGQSWVEELMKENDVKSLPRPWPKDDKPDVPRELERALDSRSFWQGLKIQPSIGRCDDYGPGGGGATLKAPITPNKGAL